MRRGSKLNLQRSKKKAKTQSKEWKKKRIFLKKKRAKRTVLSETKEGTTYQSSIGLQVDQKKDDIENIPDMPDDSHQVVTTDAPLVVFDLETTGLSRYSDITQIAACNVDRIFSRYIFPNQPISAEASRITGLTVVVLELPDYKLRETGVSGQRTPQGPTPPRESDLPTLQQCPIQGCLIRALDIQPHVMLEHVAEVFGEPPDQSRASLAPIRVAALQAQAWMLVGGDLEDLVTHVNMLAITRPHIIGQAVQGQMEEVCLEGGRPVPPYFSTAPVNSPGALIDWRVQAAIMGELGDRAEAFRGMFRLQGPRAATGSPAGQAEGE
ncbi:unnamed protein product [Mytilus edulis]|uniref:Exonuclease domain-containing protein n=1 Tax=Mytilus edulis TaxID=6550 RepID=A0A8S3Q289_MYTED|nr:unnamed protein product [Mytilus edulis]